jgi:hypothetical protein
MSPSPAAGSSQRDPQQKKVFASFFKKKRLFYFVFLEKKYKKPVRVWRRPLQPAAPRHAVFAVRLATPPAPASLHS